MSLLRELAEQSGVPLEPNGLYVPPSDPVALRRAIEYLLDHPDERARLGAAARRTVERFMSVEHFAARMSAWVEGAHPIDDVDAADSAWDDAAIGAAPAR